MKLIEIGREEIEATESKEDLKKLLKKKIVDGEELSEYKSEV